jgi:hypothetical protein
MHECYLTCLVQYFVETYFVEFEISSERWNGTLTDLNYNWGSIYDFDRFSCRFSNSYVESIWILWKLLSPVRNWYESKKKIHFEELL